jgi:hypothetical protein
VPTAVPPHDPEYQCHVAAAESVPVNVRAEETPEHREDGVAAAAVAAEGNAVTVTAVFLHAEKHVPFSARTK